MPGVSSKAKLICVFLYSSTVQRTEPNTKQIELIILQMKYPTFFLRTGLLLFELFPFLLFAQQDWGFHLKDEWYNTIGSKGLKPAGYCLG
jgi:hypothetical protein